MEIEIILNAAIAHFWMPPPTLSDKTEIMQRAEQHETTISELARITPLERKVRLFELGFTARQVPYMLRAAQECIELRSQPRATTKLRFINPVAPQQSVSATASTVALSADEWTQIMAHGSLVLGGHPTLDTAMRDLRGTLREVLVQQQNESGAGGGGGGSLSCANLAGGGASSGGGGGAQSQSNIIASGLRNQGATCYLNSLLQVLFHLVKFRSTMFSLPIVDIMKRYRKSQQQQQNQQQNQNHSESGGGTSPTTPTSPTTTAGLSAHDEQSVGIARALQRLYVAMEVARERSELTSCTTVDLTHSFGWTDNQAFVQHDIHECAALLLEKVDGAVDILLKFQQDDDPAAAAAADAASAGGGASASAVATARATSGSGSKQRNDVHQLFVLKLKQFIRTIDIEYESSHIDQQCYLSLPVKNCPTIYHSLDQYFGEDELDGYCVEAEDGSKSYHPARKGVIMAAAPPVILLCLMRSDFDPQTGEPVKVVTRSEYYRTLDLSPYIQQQQQQCTRYVLQAVSVHSGSQAGFGHYYAFARVHVDRDVVSNRDDLRHYLPENEDDGTDEDDDGDQQQQQQQANDGATAGAAGQSDKSLQRPRVWVKLNDSTVTLASDYEVYGNNFGGEKRNYWGGTDTVTTNAALLCYVRADVKSSVLCDPLESHPGGDFLSQALRQQHDAHERQEARKRAQQAETRTHTALHAVTINDALVTGAKATADEFLFGCPWNTVASNPPAVWAGSFPKQQKFRAEIVQRIIRTVKRQQRIAAGGGGGGAGGSLSPDGTLVLGGGGGGGAAGGGAASSSMGNPSFSANSDGGGGPAAAAAAAVADADGAGGGASSTEPVEQYLVSYVPEAANNVSRCYFGPTRILDDTHTMGHAAHSLVMLLEQPPCQPAPLPAAAQRDPELAATLHNLQAAATREVTLHRFYDPFREFVVPLGGIVSPVVPLQRSCTVTPTAVTAAGSSGSNANNDAPILHTRPRDLVFQLLDYVKFFLRNHTAAEIGRGIHTSFRFAEFALEDAAARIEEPLFYIYAEDSPGAIVVTGGGWAVVPGATYVWQPHPDLLVPDELLPERHTIHRPRPSAARATQQLLSHYPPAVQATTWAAAGVTPGGGGTTATPSASGGGNVDKNNNNNNNNADADKPSARAEGAPPSPMSPVAQHADPAATTERNNNNENNGDTNVADASPQQAETAGDGQQEAQNNNNSNNNEEQQAPPQQQASQQQHQNQQQSAAAQDADDDGTGMRGRNVRFPTACEWSNYHRHKCTIKLCHVYFRRGFQVAATVEAPGDCTFDEFVEIAADALRLPPEEVPCLRLAKNGSNTDSPECPPNTIQWIKRANWSTLSLMLRSTAQRTGYIFYEVLTCCTREDAEQRPVLSFELFDAARVKPVSRHHVALPPYGEFTFTEMLYRAKECVIDDHRGNHLGPHNSLQAHHADHDNNDAEEEARKDQACVAALAKERSRFALVDVFNGRIYHWYASDDLTIAATPIANLEVNTDFRLEVLPPLDGDAQQAGGGAAAGSNSGSHDPPAAVPNPRPSGQVTIVHYSIKPNPNDRTTTVTVLHGDPFFHVLEPDETVGRFRERVAERLGLPVERIQRWYVRIVGYGFSPITCDADDNAAPLLVQLEAQRERAPRRADVWIGLEHAALPGTRASAGHRREERAFTIG